MLKSRYIFALALIILLGFWGSKVVAQTSGPVVLTDEQDQYPLGMDLEILEDKDKEWTIEDVTSSEIASQFEPSQEVTPGFGFTDSAYWVRIQVRNEANSDTDWVLLYSSAAFFVDYYLPQGNGESYYGVQTGSALPFATRDLPVEQFAFQLPISPQESKTVYMRFASEGTLILSLTLLSEETFAQQSLTQRTINGILYGILLILIVYNLSFFVTLREKSYLYYVLFFSSMLLAIMSLDGIAAQYIWPNQGLLAASAVRFFMVLAFTFALLFATSYLQTKESMPRLHKIMISLAIASIVFLGLQYIWFRGTAVIHVLLMLASIISLIIAGLIAWQRGYKPARYFLFGWAIILLGFTIFVLTLVDVVPLTLITDSILRIGLVVLALVLSIGLSERIDIYRQEKEAAQMATIAQRTRIAQDLHDSVTQSLYSANLFAEAGKEVLEAKNVQGVNHYLERIISTTQQALKEMRLFLYELRPPDVVEDGLVDALQKRLDTVEKRAGMEANLLIDGPLNFPDPVSDQFYRISQEALNNVLKHAEANEVTVYLQAINGMMELEVEDDGRGFDLSEAHKKGGLGLRNMQERASQMNGEFTIKTAPNQGTIVKVKVMKSNE